MNQKIVSRADEHAMSFDSIFVNILFDARDFKLSQHKSKLKFRSSDTASTKLPSGRKLFVSKGREGYWYFTHSLSEKNGSTGFNGNVEARIIIEREHGASLRRVLSTDGKSNFVPVSERLNPSIPLSDIIRQKVPESLFNKLESLRSQLDGELHAHFSGVKFSFRSYSINKLEIDCDVISPVGEDFGTSPFIRSSLTNFVRKVNAGVFVGPNSNRVPDRKDAPTHWLNNLEETEEIPGVGSYRGDLYDKTKCKVYCKQRPTVEAGQMASGWLQRIEWSIPSGDLIADVRKANAGNGRKTFCTLDQLKELLDDFYSIWFDRVYRAFGFNYPKGSTRIINGYEVSDARYARARQLIRDACPYASEAMIEQVLGSGKINLRSRTLARPAQIQRCIKAKLFVKPEGRRNTGGDYIFNWSKV